MLKINKMVFLFLWFQAYNRLLLRTCEFSAAVTSRIWAQQAHM